MIYIALAFLIIGAALFVTEMFIPGFGVCGMIGTILVVVSAIITVAYVPFGLFIVAGEVVVMGFVLLSLVKYIRKKQLYGKLVLDESLEFDDNPGGDLQFYIGKEGVVLTPLKPVGNADFNGAVLEVYSEGRYIPENKRVQVVDVLKQKVIVKQIGQ